MCEQHKHTASGRNHCNRCECVCMVCCQYLVQARFSNGTAQALPKPLNKGCFQYRTYFCRFILWNETTEQKKNNNNNRRWTCTVHTYAPQYRTCLDAKHVLDVKSVFLSSLRRVHLNKMNMKSFAPFPHNTHTLSLIHTQRPYYLPSCFFSLSIHSVRSFCLAI